MAHTGIWSLDIALGILSGLFGTIGPDQGAQAGSMASLEVSSPSDNQRHVARKAEIKQCFYLPLRQN